MHSRTSLLALAALAVLIVGVSLPWLATSIVVIVASGALALLPLVLGWRSPPAPSPPLVGEESPGYTSRPIPMHEPPAGFSALRAPARLPALAPFSREALDEPLALAGRVVRG